MKPKKRAKTKMRTFVTVDVPKPVLLAKQRPKHHIALNRRLRRLR